MSTMHGVVTDDDGRLDYTEVSRSEPLGFGHGLHVCLGMHLARLEMDCLFNALADRVERFELIGEPKHALISTIHSHEHLPVRIHPCTSAESNGASS